jgi:predicted GNAT family acetyltransferase
VNVSIRDAPDRERYELEVDGTLAGFLEYRGHGDTRALTHTEIDPSFEGRGLGSRLISAVLDDVRAQGLHVLPICPFVKAHLANHPDQLDLVEPRLRVAFGLPEPTPTSRMDP